MNEIKAIFDGEVQSYLKVERKDGRVEYYKVIDEQSIPISKDEYERNN